MMNYFRYNRGNWSYCTWWTLCTPWSFGSNKVKKYFNWFAAERKQNSVNFEP